MAGQGIPNDDRQADAWTREAAGAPHLVWEIGADGAGGPPFVYTKRMAQVRNLADKYPQIEGVLLDDMSTVGIDKGFQPEHIRQIRGLLDGKYARVKVWGVLYTMSFNRPKIDDYIKELDVINLWTWHAKDVADLDKNVAHCEEKYPGKPIVLGLYLYDYGAGRRMPMDLMARAVRDGVEARPCRPDPGHCLPDHQRRSGDPCLDGRLDQAGRGSEVGQEAMFRPVPRHIAAPVRVAGFANAGQPVTNLKIGDGGGWHFTSGPWKEVPTASSRPPNQRNLHSRALS